MNMHPACSICKLRCPGLALFAASAVVALSGFPAFAQTGLTLDANGGIALIAQDGHRTVLAEQGHCNEISGTPDNRLMVCFVSRGIGDNGFRPQFQIEIYHDDGSKFTLEPGGAIRDWHFWNDDHQIAISFKASDGELSDALYSLDSGDLVERIAEPADLTGLPRWAKSQIQIDDESVPIDAESQEAQNKWIGKTLRQIETIQPGMRRRDLATLFSQDGGINPIGGQYRYVFKECTMIKIDVSFKPPDQSSPAQPENAEDVIDRFRSPIFNTPSSTSALNS